MHSISDTAPAETLVERLGTLGLIRLNRPKALNSLTLGMVRDIDAALDAFEADAGIAAVLFVGEGERGFCAGGDIRAMHDSGRAGDGLATRFWREEYRLDARIARFPKPTVALMDGIVMGGGVGLSAYARHRIVTERTRFAMPETGIGFFPDVGGSWFLSRQSGEGGTFLGLTGEIIGAGDVIALGIADHFMASERRERLIEALAAAGDAAQVAAAIAQLAAPAPAAMLASFMAAIDRLFAHDRIEAIVAALEADDSDFAGKTLATLTTKSPRSLHVTLRLLRLGRQATRLEDCLEREFAATDAVLANPDFYEGVRAAVIDKDRNPRWQPATLEAVSDADIAAFFPAEHERLFSG